MIPLVTLLLAVVSDSDEPRQGPYDVHPAQRRLWQLWGSKSWPGPNPLTGLHIEAYLRASGLELDSLHPPVIRRDEEMLPERASRELVDWLFRTHEIWQADWPSHFKGPDDFEHVMQTYLPNRYRSDATPTLAYLADLLIHRPELSLEGKSWAAGIRSGKAWMQRMHKHDKPSAQAILGPVGVGRIVYRFVDQSDASLRGWTVQKLTTPQEIGREAEVMRNDIDDWPQSDAYAFYSLRDREGRPHMSFVFTVDDRGRPEAVELIQGHRAATVYEMYGEGPYDQRLPLAAEFLHFALPFDEHGDLGEEHAILLYFHPYDRNAFLQWLKENQIFDEPYSRAGRLILAEDADMQLNDDRLLKLWVAEIEDDPTRASGYSRYWWVPHRIAREQPMPVPDWMTSLDLFYDPSEDGNDLFAREVRIRFEGTDDKGETLILLIQGLVFFDYVDQDNDGLWRSAWRVETTYGDPSEERPLKQFPPTYPREWPDPESWFIDLLEQGSWSDSFDIDQSAFHRFMNEAEETFESKSPRVVIDQLVSALDHTADELPVILFTEEFLAEHPALERLLSTIHPLDHVIEFSYGEEE